MHPRHEKNLTNHAKMRAAQRYYVALSNADISAMERQISAEEIVSQKRETASRSEVVFTYGAKTWRAIFSRRYKKIVTFLPMMETNG